MKLMNMTLVALILAGAIVAAPGAGEVAAGEVAVVAELPTLESLRKEYDAAMGKMMVQYRAAKTDEEKREAMGLRPDPKKTADLMLPLIKAQADDPAVLPHVAWVLTVRRGAGAEELIEVVEQHKGSKEISEILLQASYDRSGKLKELAAWARENSPHKEVQAVAAYSKSQERGLAEADKIMELKFAVANAGEIEFRGRKLADVAAGALYEMENLAIGSVADEIEGVGLDGAPLKLSDYRGKVVVLDFWGDW